MFPLYEYALATGINGSAGRFVVFDVPATPSTEQVIAVDVNPNL